MDWSRHTVKKYFLDEKTREAKETKLIRRLGYIGDQLIERGLVLSEIEHKEHIS